MLLHRCYVALIPWFLAGCVGSAPVSTEARREGLAPLLVSRSTREMDVLLWPVAISDDGRIEGTEGFYGFYRASFGREPTEPSLFALGDSVYYIGGHGGDYGYVVRKRGAWGKFRRFLDSGDAGGFDSPSKTHVKADRRGNVYFYGAILGGTKADLSRAGRGSLFHHGAIYIGSHFAALRLLPDGRMEEKFFYEYGPQSAQIAFDPENRLHVVAMNSRRKPFFFGSSGDARGSNWYCEYIVYDVERRQILRQTEIKGLPSDPPMVWGYEIDEKGEGHLLVSYYRSDDSEDLLYYKIDPAKAEIKWKDLVYGEAGATVDRAELRVSGDAAVIAWVPFEPWYGPYYASYYRLYTRGGRTQPVQLNSVGVSEDLAVALIGNRVLSHGIRFRGEGDQKKRVSLLITDEYDFGRKRDR